MATQNISYKRILIPLFIISFLIGAVFIISRSKNKKIITSPLSMIQNKKAAFIPSPTPMPFEEMTIPYLRSRKYSSKLGTLESLGSNGSYSSYLTNYDSDGLKINGLLTKPAGEPPAGGWPAIVFIHGYIPPTIYETNGQSYSAYVSYLARNGFVVFKIDLRGHDDSEGTPGGAYYSSDYIIDALSAYSALENTDFVNPKKIGMWGHSMAGNVVIRSVAAKPTIPAVAIWAGAGFTYEDLQKYGIDDNSYRPPTNDTQRQRRRQMLFDTYGQFSKDSQFWKQVTPATYFSDVKGSIALHHAIDDDVVNIGYSRDLATMLEEKNVLHDLHEYSSGGHNISGANFNQAMAETVKFFKKYL